MPNDRSDRCIPFVFRSFLFILLLPLPSSFILFILEGSREGANGSELGVGWGVGSGEGG